MKKYIYFYCFTGEAALGVVTRDGLFKSDVKLINDENYKWAVDLLWRERISPFGINRDRFTITSLSFLHEVEE